MAKLTNRFYRSLLVASATTLFAGIATPAMAGVVPRVPEPTSATLLVTGIAGVLIVVRFWRSK